MMRTGCPIRHNGLDLPFRVFGKVDQAAIIENKRVGAVLATSASGRTPTSRPGTATAALPRATILGGLLQGSA
jgi:hypothetical protein